MSEKTAFGPILEHLGRLEALPDRIAALKAEAASVGDWKQVELCELALAGDFTGVDFATRRAARKACVEVLSDAEAQFNETHGTDFVAAQLDSDEWWDGPPELAPTEEQGMLEERIDAPRNRLANQLALFNDERKAEIEEEVERRRL